jgi:hypothetical protein
MYGNPIILVNADCLWLSQLYVYFNLARIFCWKNVKNVLPQMLFSDLHIKGNRSFVMNVEGTSTAKQLFVAICDLTAT